jgi:hypothetical protein
VGRGRPDALGAVVARTVLDDEDLEPILRPIELAEVPDRFDRVIGAAEVDEDDGDDTRSELGHWRLSGVWTRT